jgi:aminomethyltransferase
MNFGSDMTLANNPFQIMGFERLVEEQPQDYIGKEALERIRTEGVKEKLVGIEMGSEEFAIDPSNFWPAFSGGNQIGKVTEAVWSPRFNKMIGYVWVPIELSAPGHKLDIESEHGRIEGTTTAIPLFDPKKEIPAGSLKT